MTALFVAVLNMSITASIVVLAVILMRIPLKKSPKVFSYALWGVVILRLIFPISIESIFSLMPTRANIMPYDIVYTRSFGAQITNIPIDTTTYNPLPITPLASEANLAVLVIQIASYIWFVGFIVLLICAVSGYISLKRRICFATLVQDNVFETDRIKTPFVFGFIRPKIYFPTTIDLRKHDYILRHEQIHIKRRDYLIKPFAYIVFALHWFNPLMWIAYFLMSKDMEMSCDEAVLKKADEDIRKDYSTSLLNLAVKRVNLLNPIAFSIGKGNVMDRISNVLKFKKAANWVTVLSVIAVSAFLVGFSTDRVLVIDAQSSINNNVIADFLTFDFDTATWYPEVHSANMRNASSEEAHYIGLQVLERYFSAFRYEWDDWQAPSFYLNSHENGFDMDGNPLTPLLSGRVSQDIEGERLSAYPFTFLINADTGILKSTNYFPPITEYIESHIVPFSINFEEAYNTHGYWWFWQDEFPFNLNDEYLEMLTSFSLEFLDENGFRGAEIISSTSSASVNFAHGFVNAGVNIVFSSGKSASFSFWIFDTHFTISALSFTY